MAQTRNRHGLKALKARVTVRGLSAIDGRTIAAQSLFAWRVDLLNALGGQQHVSPQKIALIDLAVRTKLYIDHLDAFLLSQPSLVNRRKKSILPALRERQSLVDSLGKTLAQIGLERVPAPVPDLQTYLRDKYGSTGDAQSETQNDQSDDKVKE
jgi:hypothetical protein